MAKKFYEHINSNEESLESIRKYIINNPLGWENDHENPGDISQQHGLLLNVPF
ncbi:MAG: hypothetical protein V7K27_21580 [Nostoc sp.]|uniref:hypothetical protein n=1 Tax=Nostoc sp. TaxID=1180 RepID=UPI002FFB4A95